MFSAKRDIPTPPPSPSVPFSFQLVASREFPVYLLCTLRAFMPLFDDAVRTERRPRYENESVFDYLNSSARPGSAAVRLLMENWFDEYPIRHAPDIRTRFRSRTAVDHQGAFWELYLHTLLRRMGYDVEPHPPVPGVTSHPDFLARGATGR